MIHNQCFFFNVGKVVLYIDKEVYFIHSFINKKCLLAGHVDINPSAYDEKGIFF